MIASQVGTLDGWRTDNLRWYHDLRIKDAKSSFVLLLLSISDNSYSGQLKLNLMTVSVSRKHNDPTKTKKKIHEMTLFRPTK